LVVNILGSICIGFVMQVGINSDIIPRSLRVIITVGFLGAFTTFSTFGYETAKFIEDGVWLSGIINIVANIGLGILATLLGILLGRITLGGVG
jgi:CrcB protein